jgi:hypothetical protein
MVANDAVWNQQPKNLTNAAQVLTGTRAAAYRARSTWDMSNAHAKNAASASAVVSIYRQEVIRIRNTDYTLASKALAKALLDSIGDKNQVLLKTLNPTLRIHSSCLTRYGQGETPYRYFELYLVTVVSFPSVALVMMGYDYYARYPAIAQQNLTILLPGRHDGSPHQK